MMNRNGIVLSKRRTANTSSSNDKYSSSSSSSRQDFRKSRRASSSNRRQKGKLKCGCLGKLDIKEEIIPLIFIIISVMGLLYGLYHWMEHRVNSFTIINNAMIANTNMESLKEKEIPFPKMAERVQDVPNFIDVRRPDPWRNHPDEAGPLPELRKAAIKLEQETIKPSLPFHHVDYKPEVGDATVEYAKFRHFYEEYILPPSDTQRTKARVEQLIQELPTTYHVMPNPEYDVMDCPSQPPSNYPMAWRAKEVLEHWPTDTIDPPPDKSVYQGICVFDYQNPLQYQSALNYQAAEVPFVIRNDPSVLRTVERWNHPHYLSQLLGKVPHRCEHSQNNHFMYFNKPRPPSRKKKTNQKNVPEDWKPPTELLHLSFDEFMEKANDEGNWSTKSQHWYYRLIGCGNDGQCDFNSSEYLFDELPIFQPSRGQSIYLKQPERQKGIHCRFGMKGVIAENHYDGSRNMIAVLGGQRRYLLGHPNQCLNMALYPIGHPSARHSAVDWSDPTTWDEYPQFTDLAEINEIVLQPGDVLYLPTHWFHYIVSLTTNFQCNTRSGIGTEYASIMKDCGFK